MPAFVKHEDSWERAKEIVRKQYPDKKGAAFWKIVTSIYKNMEPADMKKTANCMQIMRKIAEEEPHPYDAELVQANAEFERSKSLSERHADSSVAAMKARARRAVNNAWPDTWGRLPEQPEQAPEGIKPDWAYPENIEAIKHGQYRHPDLMQDNPNRWNHDIPDPKKIKAAAVAAGGDPSKIVVPVPVKKNVPLSKLEQRLGPIKRNPRSLFSNGANLGFDLAGGLLTIPATMLGGEWLASKFVDDPTDEMTEEEKAAARRKKRIARAIGAATGFVTGASWLAPKTSDALRRAYMKYKG